MAKYEAHITMDKMDNTVKAVQGGLGPWVYSCIDDDPVMGQKPYCYLTGYHEDPSMLKARMEYACSILKNDLGIPVLRTKIERIVFDSKTGVNEIEELSPIP